MQEKDGILLFSGTYVRQYIMKHLILIFIADIISNAEDNTFEKKTLTVMEIVKFSTNSNKIYIDSGQKDPESLKQQN